MLRGGVLASSTWQARSRAVLVKAGGADGGGGRQPWDVVRFVRTVLFFNEPPRPERVLKDLQQAVAKAASGLGLVAPGQQDPAAPVVPLDLPLAQGQAHSDPPLDVPVDGIIMVTGATGGVGKRVVQKLLAAGKHVRALVRDVDKAVPLLSTLPVAAGGRLELACADVTQRQTLLPEMFAGVRAVVCCTAVKVQPKEGDTANRAKYYQGIKFYDPEIAGDTPEAVELVGLRNLLDAAKEQLGTEAGEPLLLADGSGQAWGALDDVVMGGVSSSSMAPREGAGENGGPAMVFSGTVSTDNFGGFASVRTRNFDPALDLGAYSGLELRLLGDGQRYKFIIRTESAWDGIGYTTSFDTQPGVWQTVRLPFDSFVPVFRARSLRDAPHMNPSSVSSIQLMLSKFEYDGQLNPKFRAGPFALPIEHITTYLPENASARFVHVSSAGVTRPNRPGINVEVEPPAVRMNDMLGGILTYKLAGEDALRASGIPYAIVRPTALTEEPAGMPLEFDQGDVIKGKIGREDVAELCIALLSQPAATNTTFEVKSTVPFSQPWTVDPSNPPPRRDWAATLAAANLRRGVTGRTVQGVYTGRLPEEEVLKVAMATAPATAGAAS